MDDLVSAPINAEASPAPSPMPLYETPTYKKDGKEYKVNDPLDNYGVSSDGVFTHPAAKNNGATVNSGVKGRVPSTPGLAVGGNGIQVRSYNSLPLPHPTKEFKVDIKSVADSQRMMVEQFKDTEKQLEEGKKAAEELANEVKNQKIALEKAVKINAAEIQKMEKDIPKVETVKEEIKPQETTKKEEIKPQVIEDARIDQKVELKTEEKKSDIKVKEAPPTHAFRQKHQKHTPKKETKKDSKLIDKNFGFDEKDYTENNFL